MGTDLLTRLRCKEVRDQDGSFSMVERVYTSRACEYGPGNREMLGTIVHDSRNWNSENIGNI